MNWTPADLVPLFTRELELCAVNSDETVAVLSDPASPPGYAEAFARAAEDLGARAFTVHLPAPASTMTVGGRAYGTGLPGLDVATDALASSDLVIDLVRLLFSPEQARILAGGARMLLVSEPPEVLRRLLPNPALRARVERAAARLKDSSLLRICSDAGTEMTFPLGQYGVLDEYGYTDTPGRWDHWPSGFVCTWPNEGTAQGRIVLQPGDIVFPFKDYVRTPITIEVEDGFITDIDGEFDAMYLSEYMRSWDDPDAYAISHIGWGINHKAQWSSLGSLGKSTTGMDGRGFAGNVLFSTGPDLEVGGTRNTPCHLDIPMRGVTLRLDDTVIVDRGELTDDLTNWSTNSTA